ncbi:PHD finger protein 3 isoform X1 [Indicator indicator]|uniref:PHD finger protein 3 isoform X1 n=2 Tax=Indicator indicator TaxID=1002788 RepID=UPI0023DF4142|nr:PHD finger protein 3 isoform X1 [Indicator indicator]XP_054255276.1 PHD finger protein 3 isoform X1 [Indicator indicator]
MDEEGVQESGSDTIDDDELVLPNRSLRSRAEEAAAVTSPRKSPRLMAQEAVRSLRQSTLAKRSNLAPPVSTKKPSAKSGTAPKAGQKAERSPAKDTEAAAAPRTEQSRVVRRSTRLSGQAEGTAAAAVTAPQGDTKSPPAPKEGNESLEQAESEEISQESGSTDVAGASSPPPGETKEVTKAEAGPGHAESVCLGPAHTEGTAVQNEVNVVSEPMGSEISSEEKTENRPEGLEENLEEHEPSVGTGEAEDPAAGVDPGDVSEPFPDLSSSGAEGINCSLGSDSVGAPGEEALSEKEHGAEPAGGAMEIPASASDELLDSTELDQKDLKSAELPAAGAGNSSLESTVPEQPNPDGQQQLSPAAEAPEAAQLQDDEKQSGASSKCERNVRPRQGKPAAQTKPHPPAAARQKLGTAQAEPARSRTRAGLAGPAAGLKRNADEQEGQQNNPVKIRKKESDPGLKAKSCVSGLKKQSNAMLKKAPRGQAPGQAQKASAQRASEKSPTHQGSSRHPLHIPSPAVKPAQPQKHQPAAVPRTNSSAKGEADTKDSPVLEHQKEEDRDKSKPRKPEKTLQPRQRRSSRSLSLDEPPLFIPDNIASVRREGLEQPCAAADSRQAWVPTKQCGFCRKPHGNRFMVGCGRCDDWFHGDCVGLSLSQAQQMGEEDKEYICVRCCAEEDRRMECLDQSGAEAPGRLEVQREERGPDGDKGGMAKQTPPGGDKSKQAEDSGKHKVKIFRRESGDGKNVAEARDVDAKKGQHLPARKGTQGAAGPRRSPEEKNEKLSKESLSVLERASKPGVHEKPELKKKKNEKGSVPAPHLPALPASKPSADQIRQSVKQSLKEILMKRLSDSSLKIPEERAAKVATRIERELFSFFRDTDSKYKNKYRSLMFNLKDPKNNILFKKVLKGEVTPDHLIKMSPEELASKELAAWRQRENRHTIEMIEKEQREVERRPITKITHKGEIEIESEAPMKEQEEAMEIQEPGLKLLEKAEEANRDREVTDSASPDTTSQHKNHLFDLNCKICIGRMAPPSDDLSSKKVKVSVGVVRKPSDNEAESIADALSSTSSILAAELLEEDSKDSAKSSLPPLPKSETPGTVECESLFLARLNFIWKGFINMPSVAKFVIKAYPVSGSFDYLTEDLPDSIQVGGRISPHTVWEYVEKIKASGTKEICVVRFTPVTEEDQISYALLFAYFSSRKRYGVAANNMKQVKDLYLIPLGSSDKVPHHLVPFDGPGIEVHRPNLLLGLIIRQKMKRQIPAVATAAADFVDEPAESTLNSLPPEKKSKPSKPEVSHHELGLEEEEENDFFNSFTTVLHKQRNKPQQASTEDAAAVTEPLVESTKHEPPKPLRFLPGVLVGWENQPSALELANKPLPVDDILQSLLGTMGQALEPSKAEASSSENIPLLNEQAASKEEDVDIAEATPEGSEAKDALDDPPEPSNATAAVDAAAGGTSSALRSAGPLLGLSLKGKPPDVSTDAFLAHLSAENKDTEEGKENDPKRQLPDKDTAAQEVRRTTNSSFFSSSNTGKKPNENPLAAGCTEGAIATTSKASPFINLKRDPRQAAGRSQLATESKEGEASRGEERQGPRGAEQAEADCKQPAAEVALKPCQGDAQGGEAQQGPAAAQAEAAAADAKQPQEDALLQSMEAVAAFRRGPAAAVACSEVENPPRLEFLPQGPSPVPGSSFPPARATHQSFQHAKPTPAGFQFQAPASPSFPPQSSPMFTFPPHLPPLPLPPPAFGFPQSPMLPWPPVAHLAGQPPPFTGPMAPGLPPGSSAHKQARFPGPESFFGSKEGRRPERRHSDPWGRQEQPQHLERAFSRGKSEQHRQRFYSESQQKKERHEKEWSWEQEAERNRRRDRTQERERKGREEGQRDKERVRSPHTAEGKSPRETKNPEKKGEKPKPEEDKEKEKSKEKHRERESEKSRDRHRDHSDRSKSKR